jgi:hypothetical protein
VSQKGDYSLKWIAGTKCAQWHSWSLARFSVLILARKPGHQADRDRASALKTWGPEIRSAATSGLKTELWSGEIQQHHI